MLIPFAVWLNICCQQIVNETHVNLVLPTECSPFSHLPWNLKRIWDIFHTVSSLHRCHSSCVLERSAGLISARLCVSCRVSPKALLAPLAQAAARFQTAWADGCHPNQSVLLSLISIFQTSIYFPLASQDQNSVELIIKGLLSSPFIFSHSSSSFESSHGFQLSASSSMSVQDGHSTTALSLRYALIAYILCLKWSICQDCKVHYSAWMLVCMRFCSPQANL